MRVRGNVSPKVLTIEQYRPMTGYVEVRLRDNIKDITETNEQSETTTTLFEYDEYTFILKEKTGLKKEIEANLSDWLITGRTLEVNENASIIQDMKAALDILGVSE